MDYKLLIVVQLILPAVIDISNLSQKKISKNYWCCSVYSYN